MSTLAATIKADFPLLGREVYGKPIVYLDSAATSQKPQAVLDAMDTYYRTVNANVHRGAYHIADIATQQMEEARAKVQRFIGASSPREIIFTRNATEAVNLVAHSWGRTNLGAGDAVLLTHMEHHANIVPWHMLAAERGVELRWLPLDDDGRLDLRDLDRLLDGVRSPLAGGQFATDTPDLKAIATQAEVDLVLVGTLLRGGDRLQVNAQLLEAPAGTVVWSQRSQLAWQDIFQLQDELTRRIVDSLAVPLSAGEEQQLGRDVPASAPAYEHYLRANQQSAGARPGRVEACPRPLSAQRGRRPEVRTGVGQAGTHASGDCQVR